MGIDNREACLNWLSTAFANVPAGRWINVEVEDHEDIHKICGWMNSGPYKAFLLTPSHIRVRAKLIQPIWMEYPADMGPGGEWVH